MDTGAPGCTLWTAVGQLAGAAVDVDDVEGADSFLEVEVLLVELESLLPDDWEVDAAGLELEVLSEVELEERESLR